MSSSSGVSGVRSMAPAHRAVSILRCKVVLVGEACVGKTALTQVFSSGGAVFPKSYLMTVGAEFSVKQVPIEGGDTIVELFLFDCAGHSLFNQVELNTKYYDNAAAVMVVFDIGSRESFQSCGKWINGVRAKRPSSGAKLIGALVGNKSDYRTEVGADSRAEIDFNQATRQAKELGFEYFETSAATNDKVDDPFKYIANEFYKRYEDTVSRAEDSHSGF